MIMKTTLALLLLMLSAFCAEALVNNPMDTNPAIGTPSAYQIPVWNGSAWVFNTFPAAMTGSNTLVIDNINGNDTLAAAAPYSYPWKTVFNLTTTNAPGYGAATVAKHGDVIFFKASPFPYLVPQIPLKEGVSLLVPLGATIIRTNFSNTDVTGFYPADETHAGPLIIPNDDTFTCINGSIICTNAAYAGGYDCCFGWNGGVYLPGITNRGGTNITLTGSGTMYGSGDNIFFNQWGYPSRVQIINLHPTGNYDAGNLNDALCNLEMWNVSAFSDSTFVAGAGRLSGWTYGLGNLIAHNSSFGVVATTNTGNYGMGFNCATLAQPGNPVGSSNIFGAVFDAVTCYVIAAPDGSFNTNSLPVSHAGPITGNWAELSMQVGATNSTFFSTGQSTEYNYIAASTNLLKTYGAGVFNVNGLFYYAPLVGNVFYKNSTNVGTTYITNTGGPFGYQLVNAGNVKYWSTNGPATLTGWQITNSATAPAPQSTNLLVYFRIVNPITIKGFPYIATNSAPYSVFTNSTATLGNYTNAFNGRSTLVVNYTLNCSLTGQPVLSETNITSGVWRTYSLPANLISGSSKFSVNPRLSPGDVLSLTDNSTGSGASVTIDKVYWINE